MSCLEPPGGCSILLNNPGCRLLACLLTPPTQPSIHVPNGSVTRLIDFAPGVESPIHRALSIDYGVVIEGKFELSLDSGEKRVMLPGDTSTASPMFFFSLFLQLISIPLTNHQNVAGAGVNRGCMHKWKNLDEEKPGRMLFVLLDVKPVKINGELVPEHLGILEKDYANTGK